MITNILLTLANLSIFDYIDILLVSIILYNVILVVSRTRALPVLQGFLIIFALTLLSALLNLKTLTSILERVVDLALIGMVILFPAEIRRSLYLIGRYTVWRDILTVEKKTIEQVIQAATQMSRERTGALIVIERNDQLQTVIDSGTYLDAEVDANLIVALFQKSSALHDGALVLRNKKIHSVGCYIQALSASESIDQKKGTRHRSALGLSEQSDAIIVIVSEENGEISMAMNGKIQQDLTTKKLKNRLYDLTEKTKQS